MKILMVDDNRDLAEGLAELIVEEGHEVVIAFDGQEAITRTEEGDLDCAVMDFQLPDIEGFELIRTVRQHAPHMPIITMTGYRLDQLLGKQDVFQVKVVGGESDIGELDKSLKDTSGVSVVVVEAEEEGLPGFVRDHIDAMGLSIGAANPGCGDLSGEADVLVINMDVGLLECLALMMPVEQGMNQMTVILLVDGKVNDLYMNRIKAANLSYCIFKPFSPDELIACINQTCKVRS